MKIVIPSVLSPNRSATAGDMREYLGLSRSGRLPKEGMPERLIHGARVYVTPLGLKPSKTRPHRIFVICGCGRDIPAGRLHQHVCKEAK